METFYAKGASLKTKLVGAFGAVYLMFVIGAATGLYHMSRIMDEAEKAYAVAASATPTPKAAAWGTGHRPVAR